MKKFNFFEWLMGQGWEYIAGAYWKRTDVPTFIHVVYLGEEKRITSIKGNDNIVFKYFKLPQNKKEAEMLFKFAGF